MPIKTPKAPVFKVPEYKGYTEIDDAVPGALRAPPVKTPLDMDMNPFKAGLQMGAAGAAAGVGIAAIQRALRQRAGNTTPVSVYKPMAIGAIIGTALGTIGGYKQYKHVTQNQPNPVPGTWEDLGDQLQENAEISKYAGLKHIVKHAQAADLIKTPFYFVPGVGTALSGYDALKSFGTAGANLFRGNLRGAAGSAMGGLGNVGMAIAGLFPMLGGVAKGMVTANRLSRGAKAIKGIGNIQRMGKGLTAAEAAQSSAFLGSGALGKLYQKASPLASRVSDKALARMDAWGNKIEPLKNHVGKLGWGGTGLNVGGGMLAGGGSGAAAAGVDAATDVARSMKNVRRAPQLLGQGASSVGHAAYNRNPYPQFELPGVTDV